MTGDDVKRTMRDWETRRDLALRAAHRKARHDMIRDLAPWILLALTVLALCCAGTWHLVR